MDGTTIKMIDLHRILVWNTKELIYKAEEHTDVQY
jgi:hypothetical protein